MKPDWDKLSEEYADNKNSGIYDVDCTADGKDLCDEIGVNGYPTIKYGDASDKKALETYSGGRSFDELQKFAAEKLAPLCTPSNVEPCTADEKALLAGFLKKTSEELTSTAKAIDKKFGDMEKKSKKKASKLEEKWDEYHNDEGDHRKTKVKKGKETQHEAKTKKLDDRKKKLELEQAELDKDVEFLKAQKKTTGIKLMKLAAKHQKSQKSEL